MFVFYSYNLSPKARIGGKDMKNMRKLRTTHVKYYDSLTFRRPVPEHGPALDSPPANRYLAIKNAYEQLQ